MTEKTQVNPDAQHNNSVEEDADITPAAVLATRRSLRTGLMWGLVGALVLGAAITVGFGPKIGAFYFAALMLSVGTMRWVLPGQPFGIAAREQKWMDIVFCYGVSAGLVILASSSYALKCAEGFFC